MKNTIVTVVLIFILIIIILIPLWGYLLTNDLRWLGAFIIHIMTGSVLLSIVCALELPDICKYNLHLNDLNSNIITFSCVIVSLFVGVILSIILITL